MNVQYELTIPPRRIIKARCGGMIDEIHNVIE
jgi:hypothetical protein